MSGNPVDIERRYEELAAVARRATGPVPSYEAMVEVLAVLRRHAADPLPGFKPQPRSTEALRELRVILGADLEPGEVPESVLATWSSRAGRARAVELLAQIQREYDSYNRLRCHWQLTQHADAQLRRLRQAIDAAVRDGWELPPPIALCLNEARAVEEMFEQLRTQRTRR